MHAALSYQRDEIAFINKFMIPSPPLTPNTSFFTLNLTLLILQSASFNLQKRLEFDIEETLLVKFLFIRHNNSSLVVAEATRKLKKNVLVGILFLSYYV